MLQTNKRCIYNEGKLMAKLQLSTAEKFQQEIIQKIRQGISIEQIRSSLRYKYGDDLGFNEVELNINTTVSEYADYKLIQLIVNSKIIQEINGKENIILNTKKRISQKISKDRLREMFIPGFDLSKLSVTCKFDYNPHRMEQLYQAEDGMWTYNRYIPPFWQENEFYSKGTVKVIKNTETPKVYKDFLMHLVNNDIKSFNYILDWLANAIQFRNYCILATIGTQGVGKGRLGDIMRQLVGSNYSETGNRLVTGTFNSQLKNKRIIYMNEVSIKTDAEYEKLKLLIDNVLEIEAKGKDVEEIDNYASIYFSSNSLDAIKLEARDRRFSIVDLTNIPLKDIWSTDQIDSLTKKENIEAFAQYLYYRPVNRQEMLTTFTSLRAEEVRSASLSEWEIYFLDTLLPTYAGKTIEIEKVSDAIESKYNTRKMRPGKPGLSRLQSRFPKYFEVYRPEIDGKRVWAIKVPDILPASILDYNEKSPSIQTSTDLISKSSH